MATMQLPRFFVTGADFAAYDATNGVTTFAGYAAVTDITASAAEAAIA